MTIYSIITNSNNNNEEIKEINEEIKTIKVAERLSAKIGNMRLYGKLAIDKQKK